MAIPEQFTIVPITAGILSNLATDMLKHYPQLLEGTLVGRMVQHAGLIEPKFEDRLRATLRKSLQHYFETYSHYKLSSVVSFFSDPVVAQQRRMKSYS